MIPRLFPLAAGAFLMGILAHSTAPYHALSRGWIMAGLLLSLGACIFVSRQKPSLFAGCLACLFFSLGVLRFSLIQPSLPRGLTFAHPKGLAFTHTSAPTRTANHFDPRHWLSRTRVELTHRAKQRFSPDQAALLTGILYGERSLSRPAKTAFRHAGLTHIVAVSGSNMTIIVVIVMRSFMALCLSRRHAFYATIIAITSFTLFVGASASVVRAAIMGLLVEFAPLVGRLARPARLLLVAALVFTVWHPWALAFDPSFALSFLAMLGLLTLGQRLNYRLRSLIRSDVIREIISSTVSATVLTTPYAAWAFGNATLWGLFTNLMVLPLIPWTMLFGTLSLLPPTSLPHYFSTPLFLPTQGCLSLILLISRLPDSAGFGYLDNAHLSLAGMVALYVALAYLFYPQSNRVNRARQTALSSTNNQILKQYESDEIVTKNIVSAY